MKHLDHYPFPSRTTAPIDEIICDIPKRNNDKIYDKKIISQIYSDNGIKYKFQYFQIEEQLLKSFEFVHPDQNNENTFSTTFASIIRESCNLYELISKDLYEKIFNWNPSGNKINIFNYLSIQICIELATKKLVFLFNKNHFQNGEIEQPFKKLVNWDKKSSLNGEGKDFIPKWWYSYNNIKHSVDGLKEATLSNAIASLGAVFILLTLKYGYGLVCGICDLPPEFEGFLPNAKSSLIFLPKWISLENEQ